MNTTPSNVPEISLQDAATIALTGAPRVDTAEVLDPAAVNTPVSSLAAVTRSRLLTVGTQAALSEVAAKLSAAQISLVLVCDAQGTAVGVITETILVRQLGFGTADVFSTQAQEVMARDFMACAPDDSLAELLALMHSRGLIHLPVLDAERRPLGVLNARDGLRALLAEGRQEEELLRGYVTGVGYQ